MFPAAVTPANGRIRRRCLCGRRRRLCRRRCLLGRPAGGLAGFLTLCSRKVITDNRHARIYIFKKLFGLVIGHVHAAVGPAALIDGAAEAGPPAGVVETNASVKGHPELHRAGISLPLQHRVPLLVCNGENPRRRGMAPGNIAGDKVRLQHLCPSL